VWGMDYTQPADLSGNAQTSSTPIVSNGGVWTIPSGTGGNVGSVASGSAIIPGITITSTLACATPTVNLTDPATGGPQISMGSAAAPTYQVSALQALASGKSGAGAGTDTGSAVGQVSVAVSVHSSTLVDSWASIVE
jgi:hypothetical protein